MSVDEHGSRVMRGVNLMFTSWGVVFILGLVHGTLRAKSLTALILVCVVILHVAALLCALFAIYHGIAYGITRSAAKGRARRRIEQLREEGVTITKELRKSIYREEYSDDRGGDEAAAEPA